MRKTAKVCICIVAAMLITACGDNKTSISDNGASNKDISANEVISINISNEPVVNTDEPATSENEIAYADEKEPAENVDMQKVYEEGSFCKIAGLSVLDITEAKTLSSKAVIYYKANPTEYNMATDAVVTLGDVKINTDNDEKTYSIPITISVQELYTADNISYSSCIAPAIELADDYTGSIIPMRDTRGNDSFNYGITINTNQNEYTINYGCEVKVATGQYVASSNGNYTRNVTFTATYTVKTPSQYDGLVMKITPETIYKNVNTNDIDATTHLINEELPEGTLLIRID